MLEPNVWIIEVIVGQSAAQKECGAELRSLSMHMSGDYVKRVDSRGWVEGLSNNIGKESACAFGGLGGWC